MTDDQQRARELRRQAAKILADAYKDAHFFGAMDDALSETPSSHCRVTITAITAALRAAPESVALRVAMQSLEQIASVPDDQGAKFNAMGALRFLQTQPVELRAEPEGFVMVPVVPTREMLKEIHLIDAFTYEELCKRYAAMLAARPQGVK